MIEIKVTGATLEEIRDALNELYDKKETAATAPTAAPATVLSAPATEASTAAEAPSAPTVAPTVAPTAAPTSSPTSSPTEAPTFTLAQVAKAGADFVTAHPEKMGELTAKLAAYGVQSVAQLGEAQLGAFATELRAMGGAI